MPSFLYKNLNAHYSDQGTGNCIVLLHGFLEDLSMWDRVVDVLKKTHRVICIDLLGHGKTENLGYIHRMENQADIVKFLLDKLELVKCTLIGHSMGGYVALAFADLYPDRVSALCLMNSTAMPDSTEKKKNRDRGVAAVKQNHRTFIRIAIPLLFSEENRSIFTEEINDVTAKALSMSQQGIIAALKGMKIRKDLTYLLEQNKFPMLIIIGKKDPALDYKNLLVQAKMGTVQKVMFEDGHMSHIENELSLISTLEKFTASIPE